MNEKGWIPASDKSAILAAVLSLVFLGGGGQIYLGQWKKGLILILVTILSSMASGIGILFPVISAGDAYDLARKMNAGSPIKESEVSLNPIAFKIVVVMVVLFILIGCAAALIYMIGGSGHGF